eukprot:scaffold166300_cov30-Tisochrysis_lutea.AAC.1
MRAPCPRGASSSALTSLSSTECICYPNQRRVDKKARLRPNNFLDPGLCVTQISAHRPTTQTHRRQQHSKPCNSR